MEINEKLVQELNDLVRGSVAASDKAVKELRGILEANDARLKATEQYRKDIDALAEDLRKFTKQVLSRTFGGGGRTRYRGNFGDVDEARRFGLGVLAFCCGSKSATEKLGDEAKAWKAMAEGTDTLGGFLVPEEMEQSIIRLVEDYGVFRRNAQVIPMSRDRLTWPKRTGGLTIYCPGEGTVPTASDVAVGQVALTARRWFTLTAISGELEEDAAVAIAELVADEIALAFASKEDSCGFLGDGTSTYFGITGVLPHATTANYAGASGDTTFAKCTAWKYLAGIIGKVPTWALLRGRYFFHRSVFWLNVVGQIDASGQPLVKFVTSGGASGAPLQLGGATPLLLGFPVELVDCLPTTANDAVSTAFWAFGSLWRAWLVGMRKGVGIARSSEVGFTSGVTYIRGDERIDIVAADATGMAKVTTAAS